MPRSDETIAFYFSVFSAIQEVPYAKVTNYGTIANLIGMPERPHQVGICLKQLPDPDQPPMEGILAKFSTDTVPWYRVVNCVGLATPRGGGGQSSSRSRKGGSRHGHGRHSRQNGDGGGGSGGGSGISLERQAAQVALLQAEGVVVETTHRGEPLIDRSLYWWFPSQLPSVAMKQEAEEEEGRRVKTEVKTEDEEEGYGYGYEYGYAPQ